MPELERDSVHIHYERAGDGPPLMLIPGMLSDGASWAPLVPLLAPRFGLILPDPRGSGRTRPHTAPITLAALAADMLAVAEAEGHARIAVAGHSLGGLVALAMLGAAAPRVSGVVALAVSPTPAARLPALFETLAALRDSAPEGLWLHALFPWLFHDAFFRDREAVDAAVQTALDYPHAQSSAAMRRQVQALGRLDLDALPARPERPVLALLAEEDALVAPGPAKAAWTAWGAETAVLPKAAHALHWDAPEAVAARIAAFLERQDP